MWKSASRSRLLDLSQKWKATSRITQSFSAPSCCRRRRARLARTPPRGERSTLSIACRRPHWNRSMLFRRRAGVGSRRRRSRRHFRSNCTEQRRFARRIDASFPVGCCDKSCTLFHRLRRICASADNVCSGGTCDDLCTPDTDALRSSNVHSLRSSLPSYYAPTAAHLPFIAQRPEVLKCIPDSSRK